MTTEARAPASTPPPPRVAQRVPVPIPHRGTPREPGTAWIWVLAVALGVLYAVVSIRRHQRILSTGYDLGLVEQAVRSYAAGHGPTAELKGPGASLLGDHFAPALATLAPFYRVVPSPVTLLVAQALLLAIAVVPVAAYAQRAVSRAAALVVGLGYGLSWGIAQAVGFDAHDVMFAVPLIAFAAVALAEDRLRAAVLWAVPLLLVKEDLGVTVAVLGALVAWRGARRLGIATAVAGLAGTAVEMFWILPANTPEGTFSAWWEAHKGGSSTAGGGFGDEVHRVTIGLLSPEPKALLLIMLLAPTAMVALRSWVLLLAVPTLLWRLASDYPNYWGTGFHYSAVLMPVIFVAFVHVLRRSDPGAGPVRQALGVSALVTAVLVPSYPLWTVVQPVTWGSEPRVHDARAVLGRIPDGAQVQASNRLVPQLTSRAEVSLFGHPVSRPDPEWIVVDRWAPPNWPFISAQQQVEHLQQARDLGYQVVEERGDLVLLRRDPGDPRRFPASPPPEPQPLAQPATAN